MTDCHSVSSNNGQTFTRTDEHTALIALAGQPNMGKSTVFNLLTGLNQHVGNWPGKTVERREGNFRFNQRQIQLVDLPGTYSLTANSPEEVIAREFIIRQQPDAVIALVSAANLERSLYLVSELICLPVPLVIGLNMMDVAEQEGLRVEANVLQAALGVPVIPLTATRAAGVRDLLQAVEDVLSGKITLAPRRPAIRADHQEILETVEQAIRGFVPAPYPDDWVALKLLEGDEEITRLMRAKLPLERWELAAETLKAHDDALLAIASGRYEWIERMIRAAVARPKAGQIGLTQRLDRWAAHPLWGLVTLAGMLGLVFWLTFTIGTPIQAWLDTQVVLRITEWTAALLAGAPLWLSGLVVDGMIGGVGAVITFLPIMVIFFAALAFLEDVGYMARAAFVMDNAMHLMGLHGKSFLPLFLGFGCNVPSVMGTRVIDSRPARLLTIMVAPLVPCTARLAVLAFIAPIFFGGYATLVSWGLVLFSLAVLVVSGILLNRTIFRGERSGFVMEMPLYHLPNARTIGLLVWQRGVSFVKKAGTTILAFSVIIWALSVLPNGDLQTSFLARLGSLLAPVGRLMGMDWQLTVALLTSFAAKENVVATLGVLFGAAEDAGLAGTLAAAYTPATALAFLTVTLLFIPCAATVAAIRQETGSWRWTLLNIALMLGVSLAAGIAVYGLASRVMG
ncbi:MAG: ferrous iron transport protein B [Chloroflexota bacterium]